MKIIAWIASLLVLFGALNWGFIGFFGTDLVVKYFGAGTMATKVIYDLIGVSAVFALLGYFGLKK